MPCARGAVARIAVLLLALYTVVDFSTPFLPGAFRFDEPSIEAGGRAGLRLAGGVVDAVVDTRPVRLLPLAPPTRGRVRPPLPPPPRLDAGTRPARVDSPGDPSDD
jgi:hypothetical protein